MIDDPEQRLEEIAALMDELRLKVEELRLELVFWQPQLTEEEIEAAA